MAKGERIKSRREQLGITQISLADKVGISKQSLYKYENNIITNIPSDIIEKIADALNCAPEYLMGWEELPSSEDLSNEENEIIKCYRDADTVTKEAIKRLLAYYERLTNTKSHNNDT